VLSWLQREVGEIALKGKENGLFSFTGFLLSGSLVDLILLKVDRKHERLHV
jgi:hypothetical protein